MQKRNKTSNAIGADITIFRANLICAYPFLESDEF